MKITREIESVGFLEAPVSLPALRLVIQRSESRPTSLKTLIQQVYNSQSAPIYQINSKRQSHAILTSGNHNPNKVQEKVVAPKVKCLGPPVHTSGIIMSKHAGSVVQDVAVDLAQRDHGLEGVAKGVFGGNHESDDEAERTPADLLGGISGCDWTCGEGEERCLPQ